MGKRSAAAVKAALTAGAGVLAITTLAGCASPEGDLAGREPNTSASGMRGYGMTGTPPGEPNTSASGYEGKGMTAAPGSPNDLGSSGAGEN
jgi:hypothetical protein